MEDSNARYFLSLYMAPPGIVGVARPRHDHCAALWRLQDNDLSVARYWEFERLSGQKHHHDPLVTSEAAAAFIHELLEEAGIDPHRIEKIWGTPGYPGTAELRLRRLRADGIATHNLAHLASALFSDSRRAQEERVFAMALDGGPDHILDHNEPRFWYSGAVSDRGAIVLTPLESPGPLWTVAWNKFGLEPGSLMALGSACQCAVPLNLDELESASSFWAKESFGHAHRIVTSITASVESTLAVAKQRVASGYDDRFTYPENVVSAVMKVVHLLSCRIVAKNVERLSEISGIDSRDAHLSLGGGFALNCPTNTYLMDRFGFRSFLTLPCVNDGGQALGIGLLAFYEEGILDSCQFSFGTPYLGTDVGDARSALGSAEASLSEFDEDVFVQDLLAGPVAWADGLAEVGPRALGHRSILADPRDPSIRDRLNRIKSRQAWRPVAPIVLEEHVGAWFVDGRRSPYMLEVFDVIPSRAAEVPAIVHLDGTARIQTLGPSDDARLYRALSAFYRSTGVPITCNTSLNDKGEPIADTAVDVINFCLRKSISVAYIGGLRVRFETPTDMPAAWTSRRWDRFEAQAQEVAAAWNDWIDEGRTVESLYLTAHSVALRDLGSGYDGLRRIELLTRVALLRDPNLADGIRRWASLFGPGVLPDRASTARWHASVAMQFRPIET